MDDRPRASVADLPHRVREWVADLPRRWKEWRSEVRADRGALARAPLLRVALLLVAGILLVVSIQWLIAALQPRDASGVFAEATPYATLYVACDNPACRAHYTVQQERDFKNWPLICRKCGEPTIYRATLCRECRRWFAVRAGEPVVCPFCTAKAVETAPEANLRAEDESPDDAEDPW